MYTFIGIAFLTGTFVQLFMIFAIVIFHELGHYTVAMVFKWRIQRIMIWIFGGVMETDEHGNKPVKEEVLVTLAGPFQHVIIYGILYVCSVGSLLPEMYLQELAMYNAIILLFNLLPIWPLDGGKLIFCATTSFLSYQKGYYIVIIWSMIMCVLLLGIQLSVFGFNLSFFLLMSFLFVENFREWKRRFFVFMRFLLQRYYGNTVFKKIRPLTATPKMSLMEIFTRFERNKKHAIYIAYPDGSRSVLDENDCLRSFFHEKKHHCSLDEIAKNIS